MFDAHIDCKGQFVRPVEQMIEVVSDDVRIPMKTMLEYW